MAYSRETVLSTEGEEPQGNGANRFDAHTQTGTLGPTPPTAESGPPEQGGSGVPSAD
jgi:hypothetical protein